MNDTISLGMRMELTGLKGTGKCGRDSILCELIRMFGTNMEFECLLLKKGFRTVSTQMCLDLSVLLHMIMHRVLTLFGNTAGGTDKLAILISLIGKGHSGRFNGVNGWLL
jgi:hypothetical protein